MYKTTKEKMIGTCEHLGDCDCICVEIFFWSAGLWGEGSGSCGFLLLAVCNHLMMENKAQCWVALHESVDFCLKGPDMYSHFCVYWTKLIVRSQSNARVHTSRIRGEHITFPLRHFFLFLLNLLDADIHHPAQWSFIIIKQLTWALA